MSLTVTWQDPGKVPESWTVDDATLASLESYRQTLTVQKQVVAGGPWVTMLRYQTVKEMIVGLFLDGLVRPALSMFPPQAIANLAAQAEAARKALDEAKAAAEQSVLASLGQGSATGTTAG